MNDTTSIRELLVALKPGFAGRVVARREPQVLIRDAKLDDIPSRVEQIANVVEVTRVSNEVQYVFAHEDCDDVEPSHLAVCERIEKALEGFGCPAHAVVPAWEMEAWWFLWPKAVKSISGSWREPKDYVGRQVGRIKDAKEELVRCVRPKGLSGAEKKRFRDYQESDSPKIALKVREDGLARRPEAKSASYQRFMESVDSCQD